MDILYTEEKNALQEGQVLILLAHRGLGFWSLWPSLRLHAFGQVKLLISSLVQWEVIVDISEYFWKNEIGSCM